MGVRPSVHEEELFRDTSFHADKGHDVLVDNFLNAQCKLIPASDIVASGKANILVASRLL